MWMREVWLFFIVKLARLLDLVFIYHIKVGSYIILVFSWLGGGDIVLLESNRKPPLNTLTTRVTKTRSVTDCCQYSCLFLAQKLWKGDLLRLGHIHFVCDTGPWQFTRLAWAHKQTHPTNLPSDVQVYLTRSVLYPAKAVSRTTKRI